MKKFLFLVIVSLVSFGCAAEDNGSSDSVDNRSDSVTLRRIQGEPSPEALPVCVLLENHWYCYDLL